MRLHSAYTKNVVVIVIGTLHRYAAVMAHAGHCRGSIGGHLLQHTTAR